jgi:hypothetical protein
LKDALPITAMAEAASSLANIGGGRKDALVQASNPTWADLANPDSAKGPSLRSDDNGG